MTTTFQRPRFNQLLDRDSNNVARRPVDDQADRDGIPVGASKGICRFICQSPTKFGARTEARIAPKLLPTATQTDGWVVRHVWPVLAGTATVKDSGLAAAVTPPDWSNH